jgi:ribosome biogenesis GTPase
LDSFHKLKKEARFDGLNHREIEQAKIETMFGGKNAMKQMRRYYKDKNEKT